MTVREPLPSKSCALFHQLEPHPHLPPLPPPPPTGCAPGYKANGADAATGTCDTCGLNSYCVGAKATWASATATACGTDKVTTSTVAKSEKECGERH